jgi:OOP family OmpA-OmpF porin
MKKRTALSTLSVAAVVALTLSPITAAHSAACTHVRDSAGEPVMDGSKTCVHTGTFKGEETEVKCGAEAPKVAEVAKPAEPAPAPAPAPAPVQAVTERITVDGNALFAVNSAALTANGKANIDTVIDKLSTFDSIDSIIVTGHTDSTGSSAYNQGLSERRAASVRDYMVSRGVDAGKISSSGKGEEEPIADNKTKAGRAENRRVEIDVVGNKVVNK